MKYRVIKEGKKFYPQYLFKFLGLFKIWKYFKSNLFYDDLGSYRNTIFFKDKKDAIDFINTQQNKVEIVYEK